MTQAPAGRVTLLAGAAHPLLPSLTETTARIHEHDIRATIGAGRWRAYVGEIGL
ncbi:hypothetical protein [Micromonospora sp. NPDC049171]|uniref:hypothetical protein n=1 Tax=Micromonospora sp. NPDC049171 TaxID=3155770 RepID=UPI0033CC1817